MMVYYCGKEVEFFLCSNKEPCSGDWLWVVGLRWLTFLKASPEIKQSPWTIDLSCSFQPLRGKKHNHFSLLTVQCSFEWVDRREKRVHKGSESTGKSATARPRKWVHSMLKSGRVMHPTLLTKAVHIQRPAKHEQSSWKIQWGGESAQRQKQSHSTSSESREGMVISSNVHWDDVWVARLVIMEQWSHWHTLRRSSDLPDQYWGGAGITTNPNE